MKPKIEFVEPPIGLVKKLQFYGKRYGYLHAAFSYIGRKIPLVWRGVGPFLSRRYLRNWLDKPGHKVINLGGGSLLSDLWIATDIDARSDVFMDLTKPLPLPSNSIDAVFCEEVIEHLSRPDGTRMLSECFRILKPGGVVRITTPSLNYFAELVTPASDSVSQAICVNEIFYNHGHRHIYSVRDLSALIDETGFVNIKQSYFQDPESALGHFDTHPIRFKFAPPEWSQYWEATKI